MVSKLEEIRDKHLACRRLNIQAHLSYEETEIVFKKIAETYISLEQILVGVATLDMGENNEHKLTVIEKVKQALLNLRE